MTLSEIVLLIIGCVAFVLSFLISDKSTKVTDGNSITEEEIKKIVQDEYERTKSRLNEITDETIDYSMEKAERRMERMSNEKMLALGEYSDNLLNQINSNHQEVVFLHDMLNQNKNDLTNMLGQAIKDADEASSISNQALDVAKKASDDALAAFDKAQHAMDKTVVAEEKMIMARKTIVSADSKENFNEKVIENINEDVDEEAYLGNDNLSIGFAYDEPESADDFILLDDTLTNNADAQDNISASASYEDAKIDKLVMESYYDNSDATMDEYGYSTTEDYTDERIVANDKELVEEVKLKKREAEKKKEIKPVSKRSIKASNKKSLVSTKAKSENKNFNSMSIKFDTDNSLNFNEKILKMHKQGKSNVAIAKELGLGVGEVNLVINLFK